MNNFCKNLGDSLCDQFEIEVDVFISKKKKLVHMSLLKLLISYKFFKAIINFIRDYWNKIQNFILVTFFCTEIEPKP